MLDALAAATGCDREALDAVVGPVRGGDQLPPAQLIERIAAQESLAQAAQATQSQDLAAFGAARLAEDQVRGVPADQRGRPRPWDARGR